MDKQVSISTWSVPFETQIGLYTVNIEQDEQNQTMVDIYMNRDDWHEQMRMRMRWTSLYT